MLIKTLQVGYLGTNCYVITDEETKKCAIIDPGAESNTILDYIEANGLTPVSIFLTHSHFDHCMALETVLDATGVPVYINGNDVNTDRNRDQHKLNDDERLSRYAEGDVMKVGNLAFVVLETPGHSPGSVTLKCENALFTGDTLFRDSCGRTDIGEGNMEVLLESLKRLSRLEGDFEVYPGHMDSSTLDRERAFNYYIKYANGERD